MLIIKIILNDNPNTGLRATDTKIMTEFSDNAVFFDKDGERISLKENKAYDMVSLQILYC